jgi:hypothetical protein
MKGRSGSRLAMSAGHWVPEAEVPDETVWAP